MRFFESFQKGLTKPGRRYVDSELATDDNRALRQRDLSRQLIVLVDVLYALVLVGGAEAYRSLFTMGDEFQHISHFLPVVLALILIYFTTIHSFIDYHLASEDQPYQFLNRLRRRVDLGRFYLDILIVGLYSFALLKSHVLLDSPGADLTPVFLTFPGIFLLFIIWGALRELTAEDNQPYSPRLLCLVLAIYFLLAVAYACTSNGWMGNAEFLFAALLIMLLYRWINWRQNRWCY